MKIYMISFQRGENYGSVLQAHALQIIYQQLGAEAYLLRYYPERWTISYRLKHLEKKKASLKNTLLKGIASAILLPSFKKRKKVFDRFVDKYCKEYGPLFDSIEEAKGKFDDADAYSSGSDQIWNSHWNFGIDRCFYLDFVPKNKLVFAYSASIGLSELPKDEEEETRRLIQKYEYISMREDTGVNIMHKLGREDAIQTLDPTMLLTTEEWNKFTDDYSEKENYILTYNLHHDPMIDDYAQQLKAKYGYKVYNISYNWHDVVRKGTLKWCPTVERFLGLIKHAKFVIADSFHATVFSILFGKQFVSVTPDVASSRIKSVLNMLGIGERMVHRVELKDIEAPIDYEKVLSLLVDERNKSINYLRKVLNTKEFTHNKE